VSYKFGRRTGCRGWDRILVLERRFGEGIVLNERGGCYLLLDSFLPKDLLVFNLLMRFPI
jgi:hypothetical protein